MKDIESLKENIPYVQLLILIEHFRKNELDIFNELIRLDNKDIEKYLKETPLEIKRSEYMGNRINKFLEFENYVKLEELIGKPRKAYYKERSYQYRLIQLIDNKIDIKTFKTEICVLLHLKGNITVGKLEKIDNELFTIQEDLERLLTKHIETGSYDDYISEFDYIEKVNNEFAELGWKDKKDIFYDTEHEIFKGKYLDDLDFIESETYLETGAKESCIDYLMIKILNEEDINKKNIKNLLREQIEEAAEDFWYYRDNQLASVFVNIDTKKLRKYIKDKKAAVNKE